MLNTSGTAEPTERHDQQQLHLCADCKLKLNKQLESTLKKEGRNVNAFLRILPYKNFEKNSAYS